MPKVDVMPMNEDIEVSKGPSTRKEKSGGLSPNLLFRSQFTLKFPFRQNRVKAHLERQYGKFMKVDLQMQGHAYSTFIKDLLTEKMEFNNGKTKLLLALIFIKIWWLPKNKNQLHK